jgi:hypothetical protein
MWPTVLPRLRDRAGVKRSDLVARLAAARGGADRTDKVAAYYHRMEQGTLPAAGVSDRVLAALGEIVGEAAEALREAGRAVVPPTGGARAPEQAFARIASSSEEERSSTEQREGEAASPAKQDEVDRLFCGG